MVERTRGADIDVVMGGTGWVIDLEREIRFLPPPFDLPIALGWLWEPPLRSQALEKDDG